MTTDLRAITVKLPEADLMRIPTDNRSKFIREAVAEKLVRMDSPAWEPKTEIGRKLHRLRQKFLDSGGELLDADGIAKELRERRGGLA